MAWKALLLTLVVLASAPRSGNAFLDVLLKDDMVQLFLGTSTPFYLVEQGYDSQLARSGILQYLDPLAPERSQLTFEWSSKKPIHYVIQLNSGNTGMMEDPRANIPLRGTVPSVEKEFHVSFPCTFQQSGTTFVAITFTFFDEHGSPMYEMPFTLAMKRTCVQAKSDPAKEITELSDKEKEEVSKHIIGTNGDPDADKRHPIAVVVNPKVRTPTHKITPPPKTSKPKPTPKDDNEVVPSKPKPVVKATAKPVTVAPTEPQPEACPMCVMPKTLSQLRDLICKAGFAIRTKLSARGKDTHSNHFFLGLRDYRELRPSRRSASNALYAWEQHNEAVNANEKAALAGSAPMHVRVMVGSKGTCSCNGRVNNRDSFLVAGKYSNRRGQLVIRQTKSLLLPWREVKHAIRKLRPFSCSK